MVVESHAQGPGGGPMYWAQLSDQLIRRGHQVQILSGMTPDAEFASPNTVGLIPVSGNLRSRSGVTLLRRYLFRKRFIPAVQTFVEHWSPDIIHTVPPVASEAALRAGAAFDIPVLASILSHVEAQWVHLETNRIRAWLFQKLELQAIRRPFCRIICLTHRSQQVLQTAGIPKTRLVYVPHAVDTHQFNPRVVPEFRQKLGLSKNTFVLGYAGSISREKGTDQLLEAVARYTDTHAIALLIAGELPSNRRTKLGVDQDLRNLHFLGRLDHQDMPSFMASIDLFVIPSMTETLPTTMLEALATSTPVMATSVGGIKEFISNRFGIVLHSPQAESIIRGLDTAISQREELVVMGQTGQQYVQEHHNWELVSKLTEGVYHSCLKSK
jgi:glycosyltransferase involved in cell wall biosynthesis